MSVPKLQYPPFRLPPHTEPLRAEVRAFLAEIIPRLKRAAGTQDLPSRSPEFSREFGKKGWIGMTWPKAYGGGERSFLERYVVIEELLAHRAPSGAHWVADRQSGHLILKYGTEAQKRDIIPRIIAGDCYFCIGLSEPDSGSDLASVRTRADPVDGGFKVNGTKVWTSGAHLSHYCIALVRTSGQHGDRHKGLSQILVDLKNTPGVSIRPILNLAGKHDWNEVTFNDAFIPQDCLLGNEGDGWKQATGELAYERAGPERFMQNFYMLEELARVLGRQPGKRASAVLGRLLARQWTLRQMTLAMAGMLQEGKSPVVEAALVKDLGTIYMQELPEVGRVLAESDAATEEDLAAYLDVAQYATMMAPAYTIQGGTTQVLRGMVARGLGLR
jgi:alkylation response protein AidB-like acyl-CoA dehydrogenase